jgi:hypothetical protein
VIRVMRLLFALVALLVVVSIVFLFTVGRGS